MCICIHIYYIQNLGFVDEKNLFAFLSVWLNTLNLIISSWIHFPESNVISFFFMGEWSVCAHVYHIYCISFICPSVYGQPGLIPRLGCSEWRCHKQLCTFTPAGVFMLRASWVQMEVKEGPCSFLSEQNFSFALLSPPLSGTDKNQSW